MNKTKMIAAVLVACGVFATAFAEWWVNNDGTGFVGKGDVQSVYGWNDHMLQANAEFMSFRAAMEEVGEMTWVCTHQSNPNNSFTFRRAVTNSSIGNLLSEVRYNPVGHATGFNLLGWDGAATVTSTLTYISGPGGANVQPNTCHSPAFNVSQTATTVIHSSSSTAQVSWNGGEWFDLP